MPKEIDIFIRILHKGPSAIGIIIYRYGDVAKERYVKVEEETQNRAIIVSATRALKDLKEPCIVNLYTQSNFGFAFMKNQKKWVNRDLGDALRDIAYFNGHVLNLIDCSATDEGKAYQKAMDKKLRAHDFTNSV